MSAGPPHLGPLDSHELELLRSLAPRVTGPSETVRAKARAALARRTELPRRRRPWAAAIAVVPLAAAVAFAALWIGPTAGQNAAAAALKKAALRVANRPSPELAPGDAWYVHSRGAYINSTGTSTGSYYYWQTSHHREWITCEGSVHVIRTDGPARFLSADDRQAWINNGREELRYRLDIRDHREKPFLLLGKWVGCDEVRAMPTDPDQVRELLAENTAGSDLEPDYEQLDAIAETLRNTPLSSEQAAALYRAAAGIHGIQLLGLARDHAGRRGLAIAAEDESHGFRLELIIDPRTGLLLGDVNRVTRDFPEVHASAGQEIAWTVYLDAQVERYR
jgi:hypothetical protein